MNEKLVTAILKVIEDEPLSHEEEVLCKDFRVDSKNLKFDLQLYHVMESAEKDKEEGWQKVKQELNRQGLLDG